MADRDAAAPPPPRRSVCLFAQFDPSGKIAAPLWRYFAALRECGFVLHVACSGVEALDPADAARLAALGGTAHPRANQGLDFGAWQHLLRRGCADGATEILLANDSVFGPFADLLPLVDGMRARRLDAWGMVASGEGVWHLQSWFVCLTAAALARPAVQRVLLGQDFAAMGKAEIILHGELGLGAALQAEGLACAARFAEPARRRLRRLARINPMHLDWAALVADGSVPFLKRDLLRDNPIRIFWADQWREVVARQPGWDPALIEAALAVEPALAAAPAGRPAAARPGWRTVLLYLLLTRDRRRAARALLAGLRPGPGRERAPP